MKNINFHTFFFACFLSICIPIFHAFSMENTTLAPELSITTSSSESSLTSKSNISSEQEQQVSMLAHILNDMAFSTLIHILYDLEDHLTYWHEQLKNPRSYAIIRGPSGWLGSKTTEIVVKEHIQSLQEIEKIHAEVLGTLHILQNTKDVSAVDYATKSLEQLSSLMNIQKFEHSQEIENLQATLSHALIEMSRYKKRFDHQIYENTKPSHLVRHWWKYLLGAAIVSAAGYTAYQYKDNITQWYDESLEALKQQWQQRIVDPIKGIARNLSSKNNETNNKDLEELQQEIVKIDQEIEQTEKVLALKKLAHDKETYNYYDRRPDIPKEEIPDYVQRLCQLGDDTDVMHDINEQARHLRENLYKDVAQSTTDWLKKFVYTPKEKKESFRLPEALTQLANFYKLKVDQKELDILKIKREAIKVLYQGKQQWYLQEVNTMLGAMLPAVLVLYGVYKISASAFSSLFFKKIILIPVQERIVSIRRILNRFDDGKQEYLPTEALGHLVYWTHKLKQYIVQLPGEHQENFRQDIQELESTVLTIKQKHEVVKRMYDLYGFLKPETN